MKTIASKIILILYVLFAQLSLNGQSTFTQDYDLDLTGIDNNMIDMEMNDNYIFVLTKHFCTEDDIFTNCMRISKFDLAGNLINSIENSSMSVTLTTSLMGQSCDDCLSLHEGVLYVTINHSDDNYDNIYLYKYDEELNLIDMVTYPFTNSDSYVVNEGNTIINNTIYIYGNVNNDIETPDSARIINADLDGTINWTKYYSIGDAKMNINSLQLRPDGDLSAILCHTPGSGFGFRSET